VRCVDCGADVSKPGDFGGLVYRKANSGDWFVETGAGAMRVREEDVPASVRAAWR
jgi:hypothetical protein